MNTRELLDRIHRDPARLESVTLESGPSLPVLRGPAGRPELGVFWFPVAGPIDDRRIYAPYCETSVALTPPGPVTFRRLDAAALGLRPGPDGSIGPDDGPSVESQAEIDALLGELYDSLDSLPGCYLRPASELTPMEHAAARVYGGAFARLVDPVLVPAYRRFSPAFFAWLDALA